MSDIQQGLLITAIGMGLVFAVIIFLWGLMALMMKVTSREKARKQESGEMEEVEAPLVPEMETAERGRRAAAAAVAVGMILARSKLRQSGTQEQTGGLNSWEVFHRTRQLQRKNTRG
jgi:sodium pump decarboxylase gamma subunit